MGPTLKRYLVAAAVACAAGFAASVVEAAGEKVGDTQMCVPLVNIESTPVIDNKTILIKMREKNGFKRIDLMGPCSGLYMANGFSHTTSTNDLCTSDPLRVNEPVGATCMIKQIVTISAAEAKGLQSRKQSGDKQ